MNSRPNFLPPPPLPPPPPIPRQGVAPRRLAFSSAVDVVGGDVVVVGGDVVVVGVGCRGRCGRQPPSPQRLPLVRKRRARRRRQLRRPDEPVDPNGWPRAF